MRRECLGFEQITVSNTAVPLTAPPQQANLAVIKNSSANTLRVRGDGTDPTAAIGHLIAATGTYGDQHEAWGNLKMVNLIRTGASDAVIEVHYYRAR